MFINTIADINHTVTCKPEVSKVVAIDSESARQCRVLAMMFVDLTPVPHLRRLVIETTAGNVSSVRCHISGEWNCLEELHMIPVGPDCGSSHDSDESTDCDVIYSSFRAPNLIHGTMMVPTASQVSWRQFVMGATTMRHFTFMLCYVSNVSCLSKLTILSHLPLVVPSLFSLSLMENMPCFPVLQRLEIVQGGTGWRLQSSTVRFMYNKVSYNRSSLNPVIPWISPLECAN